MEPGDKYFAALVYLLKDFLNHYGFGQIFDLVSHISRYIIFRLVTFGLTSPIISTDEETVGLNFFFQVDFDVQELLILLFLALGLHPDLVQLFLQGPQSEPGSGPAAHSSCPWSL